MNEAAKIIVHRSLADEIWPREKAISEHVPADRLATTRYELATGKGRHVPRLEEAADGT